MDNLAIICVVLDVMYDTLMTLYEFRCDVQDHHAWPRTDRSRGGTNIIKLLHADKRWYFIDTGHIGEAFSSVRITHA